jgi:hypothetical protein
MCEASIAFDCPFPLMTSYKRTRDEHWLRDKQEQGQRLILEDESTWEIHPSDRPIAARWLRGSTIYVEQTQVQGYPYVLRNRTEGEVARANLLSDVRAAS